MNNKFLKVLAKVKHKYCIIRDRIDIIESSDLDLVCEEPKLLAVELQCYIREIFPAYTVKQNKGSYNTSADGAHLHLDIFNENVFLFRYDLFDVPSLEKHNCLNAGTFNNWPEKIEIRTYGDYQLNFFSHNLMIKVLVSEYISYYIYYPSKYKHWDYLINLVDNEKILFDVLHNDIDLRALENKQTTQWRKKAIIGFTPSYIYLIWDIFRKIRQLGVINAGKKLRER